MDIEKIEVIVFCRNFIIILIHFILLKNASTQRRYYTIIASNASMPFTLTS